MKAFSKITSLAAVAVISTAFLTSCEMEYYKEELYRKEIYIVSGENNIIGQEFKYGGDVGQLAIYASGTTAPDENVTVNFSLDYKAIGEYNRRNFDKQYDVYALELPASHYTIDPMSVEMASGSSSATCPIRVKTNGLLPDETYFIPLRIESLSSCMISGTKNFVLFKIFCKNDYATTKTDTYYTMNGTSQQGWVIDNIFGSDVKRQVINSSKLVLPIDEHAVRILPAARVIGGTTGKDKDDKRREGIRVTIDPETWINVPVYVDGVITDKVKPMQKVTLTPFLASAGAMKVIHSPKDVSAYDPETMTFYLYYCYQEPGKDAGKDPWFEVRETMIRSQF